MRQRTSSALFRYCIAVLSVIAATLLTWSLSQSMPRSPFMFYMLAVMLSAWRGGPGPGLLAIALSAVFAEYLFLPAISHLGPFGSGHVLNHILPLSIFIAFSLMVNILTSQS